MAVPAVMAACAGRRWIVSRYGLGRYPTPPSRARHRHHSEGLPMGSDLPRTATMSPFFTARSIPAVFWASGV